MVRILENINKKNHCKKGFSNDVTANLSHKGYQCKDMSSLQEIIDSGIVSSDIIIETLSEILNIPILDIFSQKVTILEFSKLAVYSLHGYFICKDSLLFLILYCLKIRRYINPISSCS